MLFKVLKSTLSIGKIHVVKTKYVEAILYGRLIGTLLSINGRGVSIQRFYILLNVDLYQFYTLKQLTLRIYKELSNILLRIGKLTLHEKHSRQATYTRIEAYLGEVL